MYICVFLFIDIQHAPLQILHALQLNIHNTVTHINTYVQFLPFSIVRAGLLSVL